MNLDDIIKESVSQLKQLGPSPFGNVKNKVAQVAI